MTDANFPTNVHILRPRKVSLAEKLDRFLDEHGLEPDETPKRYDLSRPKSVNVNALKCASCGELEYLNREYCRCDHYLRGQLEDEYLAKEQQLLAGHRELSELIAKKLEPLRYLLALSIVFMLIPLLQLTFWVDDFSLKPLIWFVPALLIGGFACLAENYFTRPLTTSTQYVENYTFEFFLKDRSACQTETTIC